ncbi:hypothetical protein SLA2020_246890 [Shorea laevis]
MGDLGLPTKAGEELNCTGVKCYRLGFVIISAATFFWRSLVSLGLGFRKRSFCRSDIHKKFRGEVMETETGEGARGVDGKAIAAVGAMENSDLSDSR